MGHRRLSIIDLSPAGHQPMADASGQLQVVFNGEIYNHRELRTELRGLGHKFRGESDTEVLLSAYQTWGDTFLDRLNGMFAFGLYDATRRRLLLARDRAGEKPLFYRSAGGRFAFASELKALLADPDCPRVLDLAAFNSYLAYGHVPGEQCLLHGIRKLPPAHALEYQLDTNDIRIWRYWKLPGPYLRGAPPQAELVDRLDALLEDAVRLQLHADVPVGILLSGGLDSSLVTAMAARVSQRPVRTFTISFPGHGKFNEAPYARLVAEHFGTEHVELAAEPASFELLPELARQYDEPIGDASMLPTFLVSRLISESSTVALGGDGGDELFGGYSLYNWVARQQRLRRLVPRALRPVVAGIGAQLPLGFLGRSFMLSFANSQSASAARSSLYFSAIDRLRLAPVLREVEMLAPEGFREHAAADGDSLLQQLTIADYHTYLPEDILVKIDRASMLCSLEMRAPFLDRRMIEFAYSQVPDRDRGTLMERKVLLRKLGERLLPQALNLERKQGFSPPLAAWHRGDWGGFVTEVLAEADPELFDRAYLSRMIERQRGRMANSSRLFSIVIFELWRRAYGVTLG